MRTLIVTFILFSFCKICGQTTVVPHFSEISISAMGDIQWTVTYHQDNSISVHVERLLKGTWTETGSGINGISLEPKDLSVMKTTTNTCRVKFHKGQNAYRLVMTYPDKIVSEEIKLESDISNDDGSLWIVNNKIILDEKVEYEILNSVGATIRKGEESTIDIKDLLNGSYFLYTKSWTKTFTK